MRSHDWASQGDMPQGVVMSPQRTQGLTSLVCWEKHFPRNLNELKEGSVG